MENKGTINEIMIANSLNGKRFHSLNSNLKHIVKTIFPKIYVFKKFYSFQLEDKYAKPDIIIQYGKERKYISVKGGHSETVHSEMNESFIKFLRIYGISNKTLKTILLFLYGDGTLTGTGKTRFSYEQITYQLKEEIKDANYELNSNNILIKDFIDRALFKGHKGKEKADFIYHGKVDYGIICSREQVLHYVFHKNYNGLKNLHIGPLLISPYARYLDFRETEKNKTKRHMITCSWIHLSSDLSKILDHFEL